VNNVKGNIRQLARTSLTAGLALSLASCAAVDNNRATQPGAATSSPAGIARSAQSDSASVISARELAAQADLQERQALIDEINRQGQRSGVREYREAAPTPLQAPQQNVVELNYEQADLREVLAELADALDMTIVIDPAIADRVSLRTAANRPLTYEDIWPLMRLLSREHGVLLERVGNMYYARRGDSNLPLEITTRQTTSSGSASELMQITPLTYISMASALELLAPLVEPAGRVVRISNSNTLAITGTRSQLARVNELLDLIDDDPFRNQGIQLYPLSNASATDVAQELRDVLFLVEGASPAYQVTAPASRGFEEISRWIRILDADRQEQAEQLFRYRVKNLNAVDLAATLAEVFRREENTSAGGASSANAGPLGSTRETVFLSATGQAMVTPATSAAGDMTVSADLRVSIVADEATNSLLIRANPRDYRQLLATINQLDTAPLQVMINAVIAQIVLTDDTAFGVDWSRVLQNASSGSSTIINTGFLPPRGPNQASALGGLLFNRAFIDGAARVEATLEAIAVNNDVRLLARPSLTVVNNMEGEISIGSDVPVRVGETIGLGGTSTTNIQYRQTGIELSITPRINDDGVVNLLIRQSLSSVSEGSGVDNNPIFQNQVIETTVVVRDGENVVLGGLIQNSNDLLNTGVPLLNRVPGLGRLFSYQRDNNERRELFIVIRPEIINVNDQNDASFREVLSRFELAAELLQD
jgi:general secretion pathway protein D